MKYPWFSALYEILQYKFGDLKDKAQEAFAKLVSDYESTSSRDKFIAARSLTKEDISELEEIAKIVDSKSSTYYDPYENKRKPTFH